MFAAPYRRAPRRHAVVRRAISLAAVLACSLALAQPAATPGAAVADAAPTLVLPDGGKYYGSLKDGLLDGTGRLVWNAQRHYEGQFVQGRLQGQGKLTVAHGVYEGQFADGDLNGPGRYTGTDGQRYEGAFVDGEYDGEGALTDAGGDRYQGRFTKGQFTGTGRMTDGSGTVVLGEFSNFVPSGVMEVQYTGGIVFVGEMQGSRPKGPGELRLPGGMRIRGDYSAGYLETGEVDYPNGDRYRGALMGNMAHGKGVLTYADGSVYTGQFAMGKPHGRGSLAPANVAKAARAGAGGKATVQMAVQTAAQTGQWRLGKWVGADDAAAADDNTPEQAVRNNEAALYAQNRLLAGQMAALTANDPAKTEMYALFIAGDGTQEVFRREVEYVSQSFAARYGTQGRSMLLANSRSSVNRLPLATTASVERALAALAQHMDKERDLLFVYLTSHGSATHDLQIGMRGLQLPQLSAKRLAELLKASGIRKQVVVVSACYSGGFVAPLQGPSTWVITASRADRTSFGCADENDFTYFGRALFKESLPTASNLTAAFEQAKRLVAQWEKDPATNAALAPAELQAVPAPTADKAAEVAVTTTEQTAAKTEAEAKAEERAKKAQEAAHSEPQMAVQAAFQAEVDAWFAAHPARP